MISLLARTKQKALMTLAHRDFAKGLKARAFFKIQNRSIGEDLVQNTFLKTWAYLIKGGKIDVMKAFLYHILNNLIIDEYRRKKNSSLDVLVENGYEPVVENNQNMIDIMDGEKALSLIPFLPKKYRDVIHMRYVQELTLREMSLITGQTRNAIAVQIHRGLEKLKQLYCPT